MNTDNTNSAFNKSFTDKIELNYANTGDISILNDDDEMITDVLEYIQAIRDNLPIDFEPKTKKDKKKHGKTL